MLVVFLAKNNENSYNSKRSDIMANDFVVLVVYILSFTFSFIALTCIQFERFCNLNQAWKIHLLLFISSMSLGWLCAQFILALTIYNGIMI